MKKTTWGIISATAITAAICGYNVCHKQSKLEPESERVAAENVTKEAAAALADRSQKEVQGAVSLLTWNDDSKKKVNQLPSSYRATLETYLSKPVRTISDKSDDDNIRTIAHELRKDLAKEGLSRAEQSQVLNRLGKHFYNQSILGAREGQTLSMKIKYLKLSVAHFEEGKL